MVTRGEVWAGEARWAPGPAGLRINGGGALALLLPQHELEES